MIHIIDNGKKIFFTTTMALFMSACGGSGNHNIDDKRANIDTTEPVEQKTMISLCENNSTDAITAKATIVPPNSTIKKHGTNTVLRVWHFQNSEELICLVNGSAEIITNK